MIEDEDMTKSRMIIKDSINISDFNVDFIKVKVLKYNTLILNFNTFSKQS